MKYVLNLIVLSAISPLLLHLNMFFLNDENMIPLEVIYISHILTLYFTSKSLNIYSVYISNLFNLIIILFYNLFVGIIGIFLFLILRYIQLLSFKNNGNEAKIVYGASFVASKVMHPDKEGKTSQYDVYLTLSLLMVAFLYYFFGKGDGVIF